ncbi:hypothetical protein [Bacillus sp. FJAT-49736]|uniref:hypothetical protein n=1 Tax=Bacillus sp. FJAT-49736 TaxID=2833582 RepID=UPI001BC92A47|nr:hypothetical protein [Bacillus sp. FJAT-49736]MBS4172243.1 hypothetical protein [Bacillus sp. FJAT-49736]
MDRFYFNNMTATVWYLVVGARVFTIIFDQLLEPLGKFFAKQRLLKPLGYLPAPFNPLKKRIDLLPSEFFGVRLYGKRRLIPCFIPLHLIAMLSEKRCGKALFFL